jgi:AcrR family transcriptional regulator
MADPSARRTQEERRGEAERRLVGAAAELVAEVGPSRVTLASVGERAGYSRGLATHHFGSKGALMQRLVETVTHQFRDAMFDRSGSDPFGELLALIDIYFTVLSNPLAVNRARLVLWAEAVTNPSEEIRPSMVAADREFREEIEKRLQSAVTGGRLPGSVDPHGLATVIIAMLRGVALQALIDDHVDLAAARSEIEQLVTARLTQEKLQ